MYAFFSQGCLCLSVCRRIHTSAVMNVTRLTLTWLTRRSWCRTASAAACSPTGRRSRGGGIPSLFRPTSPCPGTKPSNSPTTFRSPLNTADPPSWCWRSRSISAARGSPISTTLTTAWMRSTWRRDEHAIWPRPTSRVSSVRSSTHAGSGPRTRRWCVSRCVPASPSSPARGCWTWKACTRGWRAWRVYEIYSRSPISGSASSGPLSEERTSRETTCWNTSTPFLTWRCWPGENTQTTAVNYQR